MEKVRPNVSNFIESLRDIGYSFEVAVADILDNSISAGATKVSIMSVHKPEKFFCLLDNGKGMTEQELIEAMRFASRSSHDIRDTQDLGKFGLGLKTASFSQCKSLSVITKKDAEVSLRKWDIDFLKEKNDWFLITPKVEDYSELPLVSDFINSKKNGTLVIWQKIDSLDDENWSANINKLDEHLSLVFHQFLEKKNRPLKISINDRELEAFNPFNVANKATQAKVMESISIKNSSVKVTPYILPHHSMTSPKEWKRYSTQDGYTRSQGFYLYRAKRLLVHGTWWGMHRVSDVHQLVRIKIDIPNNQDEYWGIDVKKSRANPREPIRGRLRQIMLGSLDVGSRSYKGRGKAIENKNIVQFWQIIPDGKNLRFGINREHPLYKLLLENESSQEYLLDAYIKGLEAYLPLSAIQSHILNNPHSIKQEDAISPDEIKSLLDELNKSGVNEDSINAIRKTELVI